MRSAHRLLTKPSPEANPWQQQQDEFMRHCLGSSTVNLGGVLHVGGHFGEEYDLYKSVGAQTVVFFEPVPKFYKELRRRLGKKDDVHIVQQAMGSTVERREIFVNRGAGESTSFLQPTKLYDGFFEKRKLKLVISTLDDALPRLPDPQQYNLLVTDTQGFDLEVLKGASQTLRQVDYVYTEVSEGHYHDEPSLSDFDALLNPFGFELAEHRMYGSWKGNDRWGDIFYRKTQPPSIQPATQFAPDDSRFL
jgi:FkbM family methyltransferase